MRSRKFVGAKNQRIRIHAQNIFTLLRWKIKAQFFTPRRTFIVKAIKRDQSRGKRFIPEHLDISEASICREARPSILFSN